jgi:hypothetical protein
MLRSRTVVIPTGNVIELHEVARGEHRIALRYHRLRART